jgi:hypothetical protein
MLKARIATIAKENAFDFDVPEGEEEEVGGGTGGGVEEAGGEGGEGEEVPAEVAEEPVAEVPAEVAEEPEPEPTKEGEAPAVSATSTEETETSGEEEAPVADTPPPRVSDADCAEVKKLTQLIEDSEQAIADAVENDDYEKAADLDSSIQDAKAALAALGLSAEDVEWALAS